MFIRFGLMGWLHRWLVTPVRDQLVRGASPDKLAWTISAGVVLGIFPIMGSTSLVCLLAGWVLKLNQVVLHLFKSLIYPLHLALILVFIRSGELLSGAPLIAFSIPELLERFKDDPMKFVGDFGLAAWHGILAWLLVAPFLAIGIRLAVMPALMALKAKVQNGGG